MIPELCSTSTVNRCWVATAWMVLDLRGLFGQAADRRTLSVIVRKTADARGSPQHIAPARRTRVESVWRSTLLLN